MDVRFAALKCLIKILEQGFFYEEAFKLYAEKVNNPSELTNIVSGTVKFKITLDYFIEKISSKKLKKLSPNIRNILRLGIFELEFLQRPDYAAVNSYVELCKKLDKNMTSLVNAVLRNFIRKRDTIMPDEKELGVIKFISIKYSHPEWLVEKWLKTYGREETEKICEYNNKPAKTSLRVNTLKISKGVLIDLLKKNTVDFEESLYNENCIIIKHSGNIRKLPGYKEGFWIVQGESSSLVSEILDPQPGEEILDFCAAPGVKTTHIAALMQNKGEITAVDTSFERLKKINENCERLGITAIKAITGDAAKLQFDKKFDRVLVDAPCSNTGVLAARADARWQKKPEDIKSLSELQMNILKNAAKQLKPGGILVYSTCSIEPEENIFLINRFLEENKDLIPENFKQGHAFGDKEFPGMLQILQSKYNIDGFFIAKLKKMGSSDNFVKFNKNKH